MSTPSNPVQSTTDPVVTELRKLGLSANQARVYRLLVRHGELRIPEVVRLARLPRTSVCENLKELLAHGLAEEIVGETYKKYRPYALVGLRHELDERIGKLRDLSAGLDRMDAALAKPQTASPISTKVRYYKDVPGARQLFWNTLKAESTVYVYSAFGRSQFVGKKFYQNFVLESRERGIKERVLINPTKRALSLIERDDGASLARTKPKDIQVIPTKRLRIRGETFIYGDIYAHVYLDGPMISGFEIESPEFAAMQREAFEALRTGARSTAGLLRNQSVAQRH